MMEMDLPAEMATAEQFDNTYANLTNCDPANDIVVVEAGDRGRRLRQGHMG